MISVIIPMYNSAAAIERCLVSVMRQSFRDTEIIVVDDGSTDGGGDVVRDLAAEDHRIRYIRQENGGVSRARNRGLEEARGEYICFIDSDDAVSKEYLSSMYDCMQKTGADVVMCGYREVQGDHSRDLVLSGEAMESLKGTLREDLVILRYYISSPCMKIFRKDRVEALHLRFREDMALAEDRYFNNHYFAQCRTVAFVNRAQYIYYRSDTGLSRAATASCFENEMENLAYMIRFMEDAQIERREAIIAEYMCQCIRRYIRMPEEKNTMGAVCRRMKRIRQYDQPAKLWARRDQVLYDLLRRRCYAMIPLYLRIERRMTSKLIV